MKYKVPLEFSPTINTVYPRNNFTEFERWVDINFNGAKTDREYLPVFWCGYQVNNNYGNDAKAMELLQSFIDSLPRDKKYWTVVQYDDGCGVDFKDLDIIVFGMARRLPEQRIDYIIPLICQKTMYKFSGERPYWASFIGNITHPIRTKMVEAVKNDPQFYISTAPHDAMQYCRNLSESIFGLCPRGYSATSFRITECLEFGAIPVYISDFFLFPHGLDFNDFGVVISENDILKLPEILDAIPVEEIIQKQEKLQDIYDKYYSYDGNLKLIIKHLETEYNTRKG